MSEMRKIVTRCPKCMEYHTIKVKEDDYIKYRITNTHIQDIFSYLSNEEREMLITGICPDCWSQIFSDENEEED